MSAAWTQGRSIDTSDCLYGEGGKKHMAYYSLLAGLTNVLGAKRVLEIGTCHGGSACAFDKGFDPNCVSSMVVTVDIEDRGFTNLADYPRIKRIVDEYPRLSCLSSIDALLHGNYVDIVYIDALKDCNFLLQAIDAALCWKPRLIICDDVMANSSIQQAWARLKVDPRFASALRCCEAIQGVRSNIYDMGFLLCDQVDSPVLWQKAKAVNTKSFTSTGLQCSDQIPPELRFCELPGMINDRERQLYYHIVKHCLSDAGQIVDAGCFLGASSRIFGEGLRAKGAASDIRVHSYDLFRNTNTAHDKFLQPAPPRKSDLLPYFMQNIRPVAERINIYPGNFLDTQWTGSPIELCFVDIAKSPALNAHVYASFSGSWIPGYTYYLQQDFVHLEAPWVQYVIGFLADHFVFLDVKAPSLCMGVTSPIPPEKIERILADDFAPSEKARYALSLTTFFDDIETLCAIQLVGARLLAEAGETKDALELFAALERDESVTSLANNRRRLKRTKALLQALEERGFSSPRRLL